MDLLHWILVSYLIKKQHLVITVEIVITGCILGARKAFLICFICEPSSSGTVPL